MLEREPDLVPMAGCTDLFVEHNLDPMREAPRRFLDIWRLDELRGIEASDGGLRLGALSTYRDIQRSSLCRDRLPMLVQAAGLIGGIQIQNRGTIGGNLVNASPAGDTLPVFLAAEAVVVLGSAAGERRVPYADFHTGYRKTARRPDELVIAVEVPDQRGAQRFRKIGTRAASAISKVVVAAVLDDPPRFAAGSVAPVPVRLLGFERALAAGRSPDDAAAEIDADVTPIDDLRSTARYRLRVLKNVAVAMAGKDAR